MVERLLPILFSNKHSLRREADGAAANNASDHQPAETMTTKLAVILGEDGVKRLDQARVAVFGCGGVGSNCIEALARGGVGTLAIVDKDVVAPATSTARPSHTTAPSAVAKST